MLVFKKHIRNRILFYLIFLPYKNNIIMVYEFLLQPLELFLSSRLHWDVDCAEGKGSQYPRHSYSCNTYILIQIRRTKCYNSCWYSGFSGLIITDTSCTSISETLNLSRARSTDFGCANLTKPGVIIKNEWVIHETNR